MPCVLSNPAGALRMPMLVGFLNAQFFSTKMNYKTVALGRYVGATSHRSAIGLLIVTLT